MSLIAPRDIQCTLRFAVGQRFCVATLHFAKDEDAADVVRKFLSEENIPIYLHDSIYSTVKTMIWDEVNSTIRESENILDGGLMIESARLLARQYDATVKKRRGSDTQDALNDPSISLEQNIATAYSALVSSADWRSTLAALESGYALAISQLIESRENALTALRERQSQEMDRYSQQGPEAVASLVNRHVQEIEKMERKWEAEVKEAKARQKSEYRQYILESFKIYSTDPNRHNSSHDEDEASLVAAASQASAGGKLKQKNGANASNKSDKSTSWAPWNAFFGGDDDDKERDQARKSNSASTINAPFGRDGQPIASGLNGARSRGGLGAKTAQQDASGSNDNDVISVVAMLGGIQKTPYEIQVSCAPNAFSFASASAAKSGVKSNPFGTNLSAVVLITDTNISLHSTSYSEFVKLCDGSTEFLFDDFLTQVDKIKKEIVDTTPTGTSLDSDSPNVEDAKLSSNGTQQNTMLKTGDFFVTTHSNLNIDVVFHMALEKKNNSATTSKMLSGLKNILTLAAQYDITMLTLPALLLEPEFKHLFSEAQITKRAEQIVREIRAFLVENSHSDNSLRTIRLVLNSGPSSPDLYRDLVKIVHNTFNQSM